MFGISVHSLISEIKCFTNTYICNSQSQSSTFHLSYLQKSKSKFNLSPKNIFAKVKVKVQHFTKKCICKSQRQSSTFHQKIYLQKSKPNFNFSPKYIFAKVNAKIQPMQEWPELRKPCLQTHRYEPGEFWRRTSEQN